MTLDETLARMLAMLGEPVDVRVRSIEPVCLIANFYGTLASSGDVRHESRRSEGEAFEFLVVRANVSSEFYVYQVGFVGAAYVDLGRDQGGELEIRMGSVVLEIQWRADRPTWITAPN